MRKSSVVSLALFFSSFGIAQLPPTGSPAQPTATTAVRSPEYAQVQKRLQTGWNTWDTQTIAGQVLLPEGLEIRLGLKRNSTLNTDSFLPLMLIGRQGAGDEQIKPGPHAYDGSYSSLEVKWYGLTVNVESAHAGSDLVMLVSPVGPPAGSLAATAVFSVGYLWNHPGQVKKEPGRIVASSPGGDVVVFLAGKDTDTFYAPLQSPYFSAILSEPVGISTGRPRTLQEIGAAIKAQREAYARSHNRDPQLAPVLDAIETTLAWDTIYDPEHGRVISPVSRLWNLNWGGYVLFDWDTFFAADLAAVGSRDLAYANVLEILNEITPQGFVPNYGR